MNAAHRSIVNPTKEERHLFASLRVLVQRLVFGQQFLLHRGGPLKATRGKAAVAAGGKVRSMARRTAVLSRASSTGVADSLALMRSELRIALNAKPHNREVLRHLVFFEKALAKKGLSALDDFPIQTLRKARDQLQLLSEVVASRVLADLVGMMARSILSRTGCVDTLLDAGKPQALSDAYRFGISPQLCDSVHSTKMRRAPASETQVVAA